MVPTLYEHQKHMTRVTILIVLSLCSGVSSAAFVAANAKVPPSVKGHWSSAEEFVEVYEAAKGGERSAMQAIIEEANEQNSPLLHVLAGEMYESKMSSLKDSFAAERWYWKAAQASHGDVGMVALAQEKLGMRIRARENDPNSEKKALALFLVAAVNGSDTAAYTVGQLLITSTTEYFPYQQMIGIAFLRYASTGPGAKTDAESYLDNLRHRFGDELWERSVSATNPMLDWWDKKGLLGLGAIGDDAVPMPIQEGREDALLMTVADVFTEIADKTKSNGSTSPPKSNSPKSSPKSKDPKPASPFVAEPRAVSTDPPLIKVENASSYRLILKVGSIKHEIAARQSVEFEINPGTHAYHASATGVIPASGEETFQIGYAYSWKFTVVTTKSRSRSRNRKR